MGEVIQHRERRGRSFSIGRGGEVIQRREGGEVIQRGRSFSIGRGGGGHSP